MRYLNALAVPALLVLAGVDIAALHLARAAFMLGLALLCGILACGYIIVIEIKKDGA